MHARLRSWHISIILSITVGLLAYIYACSMTTMRHPAYDLTYIGGIFSHDGWPTGPESGFRARTIPGLGVLSKDYTDQEPSQASQWARFLHWLSVANQESQTSIKLLIVMRHGEGVHNVKEREHGRQEWERHWAKLDGYDDSSWADAHLTAKGESDAKAMGRGLKALMHDNNITLQQHIYSSPLTRCIQTALLAQGEAWPQQDNINISEGLRETTGVHTCDRRSTKSELQAAFPQLHFEPGFTETDELWQSDHRETEEELTERVGSWLQWLFANENAQVVVVATHSGAIRALYRAVGHPDVWPAQGSMTPLLIAAKQI